MNNASTERSFEYWPGTNQILKPAKQVAELLDVHANTLYRWIKSGRLECIRVGKSLHFTYTQIATFLEKNTYQTKINQLERR